MVLAILAVFIGSSIDTAHAEERECTVEEWKVLGEEVRGVFTFSESEKVVSSLDICAQKVGFSNALARLECFMNDVVTPIHSQLNGIDTENRCREVRRSIGNLKSDISETVEGFRNGGDLMGGHIRLSDTESMESWKQEDDLEFVDIFNLFMTGFRENLQDVLGEITLIEKDAEEEKSRVSGSPFFEAFYALKDHGFTGGETAHPEFAAATLIFSKSVGDGNRVGITFYTHYGIAFGAPRAYRSSFKFSDLVFTKRENGAYVDYSTVFESRVKPVYQLTLTVRFKSSDPAQSKFYLDTLAYGNSIEVWGPLDLSGVSLE